MRPREARLAALAEGRKTYHGRPCKRGHTEKYTTGSICVQCERDNRLRKQYGITQAQYDQMLASQHGVCAICQGKCASYDNLCVDHDHETGITRGLLCTQCNTALGKMRHDPSILRAAIDYIEQHHGEAWYPKP